MPNPGYSIVPVEKRGALLVEQISRYYHPRDNAWNKKVVIIFSHDNSVKFYQELFTRLKQLPVMPIITNDFDSSNGLENLKMFNEAATGVIAITSSIAIEHKDLLECDTVIQFDPPKNIDCLKDLCSVANLYMMFVTASEKSFIDHLNEDHEMDFEELSVPWKRVKNLPQEKMRNLYKTFHSMNINSKASYKAYMDSLRDHQLPQYFNLNAINIREVASGFCFDSPPYYKLQNETSRYVLERKKKDQKMALPIPATAKRVVDSYTVVKSRTKTDKLEKKLKSSGVKVVDGVVQLGKDRMTYKKKREHKKKQKEISQRSSDCKALRKQLRNIDGGTKVRLPVPVRRR